MAVNAQPHFLEKVAGFPFFFPLFSLQSLQTIMHVGRFPASSGYLEEGHTIEFYSLHSVHANNS